MIEYRVVIDRQAAERLGMEVRDLRAVDRDPADLRGIPAVNGDR